VIFEILASRLALERTQVSPIHTWMKKTPWIIAVAALGVGATGGYISGRDSGAASSPAIEQHENSRNRSPSRNDVSVANSIKKTKRPTSVEQIGRLPGSTNRIKALMDFYAGLSAEKLAEEAGKLERLPMDERMTASMLLFGRWAEVDPTAAMAFSKTMGMGGGMVRPTILKSWASVDPAAAAKYYAANPRQFAMMGMGMSGGQAAASIIAGEWARQDPAAAAAWAKSLAVDQEQTMSTVLGEIAKTDPRKAAEMVGGIDPGQRAATYHSVATQYGELDFQAAQSWIRTLPAADQSEALASAIGGLSNIDPSAAAKQLALMAEGDAKDRLIPDVVRDLVRKDPQAAADLLKLQGSESVQRDGMHQLMPTFVAKNPAAALAYVNSFEPGTIRDSAAQFYVWGNNISAPTDLIKVAESISDEDDRNRTLGVAAIRWMKEDPTSAGAYIEASPLSDSQKERILSGRGMRGGRGGH
jgi:hypothetical protein